MRKQYSGPYADLLRQSVAWPGVISEIAKELGLSRQTIYRRLTGQTDDNGEAANALRRKIAERERENI